VPTLAALAALAALAIFAVVIAVEATSGEVSYSDTLKIGASEGKKIGERFEKAPQTPFPRPEICPT